MSVHILSAKECKSQELIPGIRFSFAHWRWTQERVTLHLSKQLGSPGLAVLESNPEKMQLEPCFLAEPGKQHLNVVNSFCLASSQTSQPDPQVEWSCTEVVTAGNQRQKVAAHSSSLFALLHPTRGFCLSEHVQVSAGTTSVSTFVQKNTR